VKDAGDLNRLDNLLFQQETWESPKGQKEFCECVFRDMNLKGIFSDCLFADAVFDHCDLTGCDFHQSVFRRVRFSGCRMSGAEFPEAVFQDTVIENCQCRYINFRMSSWKICILRESSFEEGSFSGMKQSSLQIGQCRLERSEWTGTPMNGLDVSDSVIDGIIVNPANLKGLAVNPDQALACVGLLGLKVRK
jgi:uncharacterized protein YjbI with pentapeptide repeats